MTIKFISGDVWKWVEQGASLAHGCNLQGLMGAGIALQVRRKYPALYTSYNSLCIQQALGLGEVMPYKIGSGQYIFNLMTQKDTINGASYDACWHAFKSLADIGRKAGVKTIVMPRIASDLGRLNWQVIKVMMVQVFDGTLFDVSRDLEIIVVEEYVS